MITLQESDANTINNICQVKKSRFSSHQWRLLIVITFVNICIGMCYAIQAPFYPSEAEKKGVNASVYGMVFGSYEFVNFLLCPIYGKYIRQIGPKFMLNAGNYLGATCCILFGFINKTSKTAFLILSFTVRICEAIGHAAYATANFAIIATEFQDDLALAFTVAETSYGIGIIIGPGLGGLLYELGGFLLPFAVNGVALLIAATVNMFLLPKIENAQPISLSILKLVRIPTIAFCYYAVFELAFCVGFVNVLFQPFLKSEFGISTATAGYLFVIPGASFAAFSFLWAMLAKNRVHPMLLSALGGIVVFIAFFNFGFAPFLHLQKSLSLVIISLIMYGIGSSAVNVAAFVNCNEEALRNGLTANVETYGLISGLWASVIAFGYFIGPVVSGFIGDAIGFRNGTLILCGLQVSLIIASLVSYRYQMLKATDITESTLLIQTKSEIVSMQTEFLVAR